MGIPAVDAISPSLPTKPNPLDPMSETPASQPDELTLKEVASVVLDLIDRLTKIEKSGTSGEAVEEQLRAYRLLKLENQSAQNFASGFFNRAEPLMETMAAAERTVSQQIEEAATQTLAVVKQAKQQADGGKKLMLQVQNDAQQALAEVQNKLTEIESAQEDLRTMINSTMTRWNEQTQQITAANVEKAAGEAAAEEVAKLTQEKLTELVDRRIRVVQKNG